MARLSYNMLSKFTPFMTSEFDLVWQSERVTL
jgi:hypothetical protein